MITNGFVQRFTLFLILALLLASQAPAQTNTATQVVAIQDRTYQLKEEVTFQAGFLPMDSFTRYISVGASYTHYFSDFIGWEVINGQYAANIPSGLEQELITKYGALTEQFDVLNYYGTTNLVFTPFYTKNLLFDSKIVYGETSFVAGGGIAKFQSGNINCADIGVVFRYVMSPASAFKLDLREYLFFSGDTKQHFVINLGFAYNFGITEPPSASSSGGQQ